MRNLRRGIQRQRAFALVIRRDHAARLDRHRRQPLMVQPVPDHPIGFAERLVDLAAAGGRVRVRDVRSKIRMRQRRALFRGGFRIGDRRQRVVVHVDRVDAVARDVRIGGDDDGDGVADEVHAIAGKRRVRRRFQIGNRRAAGHHAA